MWEYFVILFSLIRPSISSTLVNPEISLSPSNGCVPGRSILPVTTSLSLPDIDVSSWLEKHREDRICIERRDGSSLSSLDVFPSYFSCFPIGNIPIPILIPPPTHDTTIKSISTVTAILIHGDDTISTVENTYHLTSMYSHCPTEPPTLPSASSFPPVEGQQVRPNLSIYSPLNGDVIYDTDIAIVASTYTEKDSTSVRLEGGEICIGYTVSLPPSSGSAVISSFHSCLTATGPFTELTIPGSKEQMVVVTLEMELKEGKEGQGGGTGEKRAGVKRHQQQALSISI